jgi:hypothetical protein
MLPQRERIYSPSQHHRRCRLRMFGVPGRIQTLNLRFRRPMLYSVELLRHGALGQIRTDTLLILSQLPLPIGLQGLFLNNNQNWIACSFNKINARFPVNRIVVFYSYWYFAIKINSFCGSYNTTYMFHGASP